MVRAYTRKSDGLRQLIETSESALATNVANSHRGKGFVDSVWFLGTLAMQALSGHGSLYLLTFCYDRRSLCTSRSDSGDIPCSGHGTLRFTDPKASSHSNPSTQQHDSSATDFSDG